MVLLFINLLGKGLTQEIRGDGVLSDGLLIFPESHESLVRTSIPLTSAPKSKKAILEATVKSKRIGITQKLEIIDVMDV